MNSGLSIVIPTLNESGSIALLIERIGDCLEKAKIPYEIIVVDDHSQDETVDKINLLKLNFPLQLYLKKGKPGKAYSLLEGFKHCRYESVCMIDADLQYPPEAIPLMYEKLKDTKVGVVVANRIKSHHSLVRRVGSKIIRIVSRLFFGFKVDIQSGLKLINKEIVDQIHPNDVSSWSIDLPILNTATSLGYKIAETDIEFSNRNSGESKVKIFSTGIQLLGQALSYRLTPSKPIRLNPEGNTMIGAGVIYKSKRFVTHTTLNRQETALVTFVTWQKLFFFGLFFVFGLSLVYNPLPTTILAIAILSGLYFADALFNWGLVYKSLLTPPEIKISKKQLDQLNQDLLPIYTILCPLYKEADVLPDFVENIAKLDWPKNKLDVILLLEEDDKQTIKAASRLILPDYIRVLVVPDSKPKTKPKACNYGLAFAKGEYLVIYDAEDKPDPLQLKNVYTAFSKLPEKVKCIQAKLNYYNQNQNLLTRFFTAEYSLWFDVILPGLQSINTVIPLGGTSNHFKTKILKELEGWDPFNVTEDADLGIRLFKRGGRTAIIDSTTWEEANSNWINWLRQRSRWIKGYMQTYLVHLRHPVTMLKTHGLHTLIFHLTVGGKILFLLINPLMWILTLSYFVLYAAVGEAIEQLYPANIFYIAVFSLVFGNYLFVYYYMIGAFKRGQWNLIKFVYLVPVYWFWASVASLLALYQLITAPHYWEKTVHGLTKANLPKSKVATKSSSLALIGLVRAYLSPEVLGAGVLVVAAMVANVINFAYNTYLGRVVALEEYGTVALLGNFLYLMDAFFIALAATVTHKTAFFLGKYNSIVDDFWKAVKSKALALGLLLTGVWLVITPTLASVFQSDTVLPFVLFAPVWLFGLLSAIDRGYLAGTMSFAKIGVVVVASSLVRLLLAVVIVSSNLTDLVYAVLTASLLTNFVLAALFTKTIKTKPQIKLNAEQAKFPTNFFVTTLMAGMATMVFLSLDLILVKLFLKPEQAGTYALLSLIGKMIFFIGSMFGQFVNPLVSKFIGAGVNTLKSFYAMLTITTLASLGAYLILGFFASYTAPVILGERAVLVTSLLPIYGLAMACYTVATTIVTFHQVHKQYIFAILSFVLAGTQVVGITLFHNSLESVVVTMTLVGIGALMIMLPLHFFYELLVSIARNLADLVRFFKPLKIPHSPKEQLRILFLNWRDTKHVWAGGAEVYVHEIGKELIKQGHQVTVFCGNDGKCLADEVVDGMSIYRRGGFFTVYIWALLYYLFKFKGKFDVIIDCENGIPFFSPLYAKVPVFLVIHHVHQEVFRENLPLPLATIAGILENRLMPLVYRSCQVITVSQSSKKAILRHNLTFKEPIVIHNGVDLARYIPGKKAPYPLLLYVGRLKAYKNLNTLIQAAAHLVNRQVEFRLVIAGAGEELVKLKELVKELKLGSCIEFVGKVSEEEKIKLYQQAWVAINPSTMEGWGITSIEANACGTPVVASDVAGLRDSVRNPETGYLVNWNDSIAFADSIFRLITNTRLRRDFSSQARVWAENFSWAKSGLNYQEVINGK